MGRRIAAVWKLGLGHLPVHKLKLCELINISAIGSSHDEKPINEHPDPAPPRCQELENTQPGLMLDLRGADRAASIRPQALLGH